MRSNPIICAIDTKDLGHAQALCRQISPHVGAIKLGLEFFTAHGPAGVKAIASTGIPIFLDLKFHDIPNTVAEAVRSAIALNVQIMTIHTMGGMNMMKAAAEAANDEAAKRGIIPPLVVGVTVLTSMDSNDLKDIGVNHNTSAQVVNLAGLAQKSGINGVVCSAHELALVKKHCGKEFKTIVPGIRPASASKDDQKRVMTPKEAIALGADYLVIGRPITQAADPVKAATEILAEIR